MAVETMMQKLKTVALGTRQIGAENINNNDSATSNNVFNEAVQSATIQNPIYPSKTYGVFDTKYSAVQSSSYGKSSLYTLNSNGDGTYFGNTAGNLQRNGTERFTEEMKASVYKMVAKTQEFRSQLAEQGKYQEQYQNLTFMPSPHGLLYVTPDGRCGSVKELSLT